MKKTVSSILIIVILALTGVIAQNTEEYTFFGRLIWNEGNINNYQINGTIASTRFLSRSNGEFEVILPSTLTNAIVNLDSDEWMIVFPSDGLLPIPKDPTFRMSIFIAKRQQENIQYQKILDYLIQIEDQQFEDQNFIKNEINKLTGLDATISFKVDSLLILQSNLEKQKTEFQQQLIEKKRIRRQATLDLLTSELANFISRAKDLKMTLEKRSSSILKSRSVLESVEKRILAYSEAYESLDKNKRTISSQVNLFWEKESMMVHTDVLLNYALGHVHKEINLVSNNLYEEISRYWNREKTRSRKQIFASIEDYTSRLEFAIENLEGEKERICEMLRNSN